jgi:hypothetical protein
MVVLLLVLLQVMGLVLQQGGSHSLLLHDLPFRGGQVNDCS